MGAFPYFKTMEEVPEHIRNFFYESRGYIGEDWDKDVGHSIPFWNDNREDCTVEERAIVAYLDRVLPSCHTGSKQRARARHFTIQGAVASYNLCWIPYPTETRACCNGLKTPRWNGKNKWYFLKHCMTYRHVANLMGVKPSDISSVISPLLDRPIECSICGKKGVPKTDYLCRGCRKEKYGAKIVV